MNSHRIRRAKILEIPKILEITTACTSDMIQRGIYQWNEHYPSAKIFETDILRKELFVLEEGGPILGLIALSSAMDEEYSMVSWLTPTSRHIYIHRLAVHPSHQGRGYARMLMDFAEDYSRKGGFVSIRLDTFSQNNKNQRLYEQRGYHKLGDIFFPKQSSFPFHCYELVL